MKKLCSFLSLFLLYGAVAFADAPTQPAANNDVEGTKAKMAEMMKASMPGEGHKALADIAGKFNYTMRWWQAANAVPQESKGKSTNKWVFGGRFLQQEVKAKIKGMDGKMMAFEGMGVVGYDNIRGEYQTVWFDNMATGMMWTTGNVDAATHTVAQTGTMSCPMTGEKNMSLRTALKIGDKNSHTFEMFTKGADGQEFKSMEIAYQRAK